MIAPGEILNSGIFDFPVFSLSENLHERGAGNNGRHLLIGLCGDDTPELRQFLEKIAASVGICPATDAFTVCVGEKELFLFSSLNHRLGFNKILFFGITPQQAGLHLQTQKYRPLHFNEKVFLFADPLRLIHTRPALKRSLWEALKEMFV